MPEAQALGATASNTAVSWTGGKDCNLALLDAQAAYYRGDAPRAVATRLMLRPALFSCVPSLGSLLPS